MADVERSFVIAERNEEFIDAQIAEGRFSNASEVVRAGLRMLEDYEARLRDTRRLIAEGDAEIASGEGVEIDSVEALVAAVASRRNRK